MEEQKVETCQNIFPYFTKTENKTLNGMLVSFLALEQDTWLGSGGTGL